MSEIWLPGQASPHPAWTERERQREAVRTAIGETLGKFTRLGADPQFGQLVDVVASAACDAAGLTPLHGMLP